MRTVATDGRDSVESTATKLAASPTLLNLPASVAESEASLNAKRHTDEVVVVPLFRDGRSLRQAELILCCLVRFLQLLDGFSKLLHFFGQLAFQFLNF